MADWRRRPLEPEMLAYARSDTHYLLSIYDTLRTELWQKGGQEAIQHVLDASLRICQQRYQKEQFSSDGWRTLLSRFPGGAKVNALSAP